jgi:hypothetical protein
MPVLSATRCFLITKSFALRKYRKNTKNIQIGKRETHTHTTIYALVNE